jgi:hypothetical protein
MLAKIVNTNDKVLSQVPLSLPYFLSILTAVSLIFLEELAVIPSPPLSVHILDHVLYRVSLLSYFCLVRSSHCDHIQLAWDHTFN